MLNFRRLTIATAGLFLLAWLAFRHSAEPARTETATQAEVTSLPKHSVPPASSEPAAPALTSTTRSITNVLAQLRKGESLPVTLEQLAAYLERNHRDAGSLLAAFQATRDRALLEEAISKYPDDPRVVYTAWFRSEPGPDDPEGLKARRQALDTLKQAAPDNSLANYLSAANYFKAGEPANAMAEMQAGASKVAFNDYTLDAIQNMTEAYMAAGYSEAESKAAAFSGALLPDLAELKQDGLQLAELAKSYQQAGDTASAQATLQMAQDLGRRLDDPNSMTLIQTLVGIAVQRIALDASAGMPMDADVTQGVQNEIQTLVQRRQDIKTLVNGVEGWWQTATPEEIVLYYDRERSFGAQNALQWIVNRGAPSGH